MKNEYSGMIFPKKPVKKRRKQHKDSIVHTVKGICFLCALDGDTSCKITEEHHVLFGRGMRAVSEANGFKVYLCKSHHKDGEKAAHNCRETRERLCRIIQREYEKTHTRREWEDLAHKNYLEADHD